MPSSAFCARLSASTSSPTSSVISRKQLVPVGAAEFAGVDQPVQQDLDVHLVVRAVHPRLSCPARRCLTLPPARANSIRPRWVNPRLPPSPTTRTRSWPARPPGPGRWPCPLGVGVRFPGGLDVGCRCRRSTSRSAGARRIARISSGGVSWVIGSAQPERGADLGGDRHRLHRASANTPPPGLISELVVVVPGGAGQPRTSAARSANEVEGIRVGSTNTCRWSNAATSRMCSDSSIPLPNTSTGHVPDPDHCDRLGLGVHAELAEVPLDALPGTLRGDAHRLVVITHRAAGGERVAQTRTRAPPPARWPRRTSARCPCPRPPHR